jgi:hypothetical protein
MPMAASCAAVPTERALPHGRSSVAAHNTGNSARRTIVAPSAPSALLPASRILPLELQVCVLSRRRHLPPRALRPTRLRPTTETARQRVDGFQLPRGVSSWHAPPTLFRKCEGSASRIGWDAGLLVTTTQCGPALPTCSRRPCSARVPKHHAFRRTLRHSATLSLTMSAPLPADGVHTSGSARERCYIARDAYYACIGTLGLMSCSRFIAMLMAP